MLLLTQSIIEGRNALFSRGRARYPRLILLLLLHRMRFRPIEACSGPMHAITTATIRLI